MSAPSRTAAPRSPAGFALIAILVIVGVMVAIAGTYIRHVAVHDQQTFTADALVESREAAQAGLQVGQQLLRLGGEATSTTVSTGDSEALVEVSELQDGRGRIAVQAVGESGLGATLLVETARVAVPRTGHPDEMPRLGAATVDALLADSAIPKHWVSGQRWFRDQDLFGLVVVRDGACALFDGVTLTGCIVSETVLGEDPFGDFDGGAAPCAMPAGSLRIVPADFLPGLAVLMPDGVFTAAGTPSSVQIEGDVVAYRVSLDALGALLGNVASVEPAALSTSIERSGMRRRQPWSASLDLNGVWDIGTLATVPRVSTVGGLGAITGFQFPPPPGSSGGGHDGGSSEVR